MQSKEKNERHTSRTRFIMALIEGRAQLEPVAQARVPLKRAMTYRLFLQVVGLRRTWDLRGYSGQTLALLTGRDRAYGYHHTERFLAESASVRADAPLTEALARCLLR